MKTYYCVKSPEGELWLDTLSDDKHQSILLFTKVSGGCFSLDEGYKVVKVNITEVEG